MPSLSFLDRLSAGPWPVVVLTLWCLLLYGTTIASLPPMDRDEARFAQASAQMLETGDFIRIRFQDTARNKKPAGIHWLQAASVKLLSSVEAREIWAYRVPSALGAWAAVLLTFLAGTYLFDRRTALLGALSLGGCLMLFVEAHLAKTDAVLLATVMGVQLSLARIYTGSRDGSLSCACWAFWLWVSLGLGFLVKGPIPLLVAGLTVAALTVADRDARWLKRTHPLWGVPLMLAIVLPWFVLAGQTFVADAVGKDLLPKLISGQESHGAPPGYYLLLATVFLFPASLYLWPALVRAWRERLHPGVRFCLAWLVPAWIVFELVPTKLPHYVLPLYPVLALLAARAVLDGDLPKWATRIGIGLWALVPAALGGAALVLPFVYGDGFDPVTVVPAVLAMVLLGGVLNGVRAGQPATAMVRSLGLGAVLLVAVIGLVLPRLEAFAGSVRVARVLTPEDRPIAAAGYHEPSLVFLSGTGTRLVDNGGAAATHLLETGKGALVNDRERAAFDAAVTDSGRAVDLRLEERVFNYSRGRWETLSLFVPQASR